MPETMQPPSSPPPISYQQYQQLLIDTDTDDAAIAAYSLVVPGKGAFDLKLVPNPDLVTMTPDEQSLENAMAIGNEICRWRRKRRFEKALAGNAKPILVAEGDSWFQFPILIDEVVDALGKDYLIWCTSAAGDTARNMVFGPSGSGHTEYMTELRRFRDKVQGFLFSAAGNDIIGEDEVAGDGTPVLIKILKPGGPSSNPGDYVNMSELSDRLAFLKRAYRKVIDDIRAEPGLDTLPIFIHGYDVPFPYKWRDDDRRNPVYAAKDQWLGRAFAHHGIQDDDLRRKILGGLINALYDMLADVAGASAQTGVWVVDCRGAMPNAALWNDEIHGTNEGFRRVAERFRATIRTALAPTP